VGGSATFSVIACGTDPIEYHWSRGGMPVAVASVPTLTLAPVREEDAGVYSVIASNAFGIAVSSNATLTLNAPPPSSSNLVFNGSFEIGPGPVDAHIDAPNSTAITGWTLESGSIDYAGPTWMAGEGARSLDMNGLSGGTLSQTVTGLVVGAPYRLSFLLAGNPRSVPPLPALKLLRASIGSASQDYSFDVTGRTPAAMGWREETLEFQATASTHTLTFVGLTAGSGGAALDDVRLLSVIIPPGPPEILRGPQSLTVLEGTTATFEVSARGNPSPLDFQWLHNDKVIPDATNSLLIFSNIALADAGPYAVIVANVHGSVTSQVATLTVTQPPASVSVVGGNAAGGGEVLVPVRIRANGNENAIGFSLSFNTSLLTFSGVTAGSGVPLGAALLLNTNDVASGRVGLGIGLPAESVLAHGTQELAVVSFLVAPVINQTTTTINFSDQPTLRQLSDTRAQVLPATYSSASIVITDSQVEGDLAPRPDGNRSVAIVDWVQMGRFVALLDTLGGSNEFQRADCAPRATRGNGVIGASDWVQVGRYAVGLDPLTINGGPAETNSGGGGFSPASSGTRLSLLNSSIAQGQTNMVPVIIECQGTENAMTFSVTFDSTKLAFIGAAPGSAAGGATLNQNASQAGAGRIGLALALPPGASLAAGIRQVVQLRFSALAAAPASVAMAFTNSPLALEVSDALANVVPTTYTAATVSVTPPPGPPLRVTRSGNSVFITWSTTGTAGFNLEGTADALGTSWTAVPDVIDLGEQKLVIVTLTGTERYFRLKKP